MTRSGTPKTVRGIIAPYVTALGYHLDAIRQRNLTPTEWEAKLDAIDKQVDVQLYKTWDARYRARQAEARLRDLEKRVTALAAIAALEADKLAKIEDEQRRAYAEWRECQGVAV